MSSFPFRDKSESPLLHRTRNFENNDTDFVSSVAHSPVYLTGHYIRQEDFDQDPYSDSEDGSDFDEDEFDDSDISGLIGEGSDDEDMEDAADRIQELKEEKPSVSSSIRFSYKN